MRIRRVVVATAWLALLTLVAASGSLLAGSGWFRQSPTLVEADKLYNEKSYAGALTAYESVLKSGKVPDARRIEIRYRIAVCLGKSEKWDRAIASSLAFIKENRGTVWEPRGLYWMGRLYLAVPHNGYRVGKVFTRGINVLKATATDKPQYVDVSQQDQVNARDALEAARVLFQKYRGAGATPAEEIQLNFDLASILQSGSRFYAWAGKPDKWIDPKSAYYDINAKGPYVLGLPDPMNIRYLYAEIRLLSPGSRSASLSLLAEALWLRSYHAMMRSYAVRYEKDRQISIPYPYQSVKAEQPLRQIIKDFPQTAIRDRAQILLGSYLNQDQKFMDAVKEYQSLITERPTSAWIPNARAEIDRISRKSITVETVQPQIPGKQMVLWTYARNVTRLDFKLYRVDLEKVIASEPRLKDPNLQWNQFGMNFGTLKQAEKKLGPLVKEWTVKTDDKADFSPTRHRVDLGTPAPGAYVLIASSPGVRAASLAIVTDLVLVQKSYRDGVLLYAANARTGTPIEGASVIVKQWWYESNLKGQQIRRASYSRAHTGRGGLVTVKISKARMNQNIEVSAMAWTGRSDDKSEGASYALTNPNGWYYGEYTQAGTHKIYSTTDRSVYRPRQTVNYRELVYRRMDGTMKPVTGKKVHVEVRNPKGELVHQRDAVTSEFGSVNGKFDLPEGAPLGEYAINVTSSGTQDMGNDYGASRFRVEEYKKPEYEVTVTPAANRVKLGQPTSVKIAAKYYFGGSVPGAKVSYRIHRNDYTQQYEFPQPYDFLYKYSSQGDYDNSFRNGPVIKQGEARLNSDGEVTIEFPTEATKGDATDKAYTVEADVQDASRRVITGSGSVKATRHDVGVFLNYPHGYALKGDRLDVEVVTLNPSDQPVSVSGTAKVYRVSQDPNAKPKLLHQEPLATDSHGRGYLRWKSDTSGWLRVAFETHDTPSILDNGISKPGAPDPTLVTGSVDICVQGNELKDGRFRRSDVFLAVKNPYYEEGDKAKALLVTPEPNCTVLLTREANNEILEKQIINVPGQSLEIEIPLSRGDVPNVYLNAIVIRGGQLYTAQQELFVPPARQFSAIEVQADKDRYLPGEKATLKLAAKDWQGRPLRTELCVSVTDAALNYIQKGYAPDIRAYFYGDRRGVATEVSGSPGVGFDSITEDTQPVKQYRVRVWDMPDGMGMLQDWPAAPQHQMRFKTVRSFDAPSGTVLAGEGRVNYTEEDFAAGISSRRAQSMLVARPASPDANRFVANNGTLSEFQDFSKHKADEGLSYQREHFGEIPASLAGKAPAVNIRSKFVDTAFWTPAVVTDPEGTATVQVTWPDNLTQWRAQAVGSSASAQVGSGDTKVTTSKDIIVRMQTPRFFVERDQVMISANIQNYTSSMQRVKVKLDIGGQNVELLTTGSRGDTGKGNKYADSHAQDPKCKVDSGDESSSFPVLPVANESWVEVPKGGESRADWLVQVKKEGITRIRMTAQGQHDSDASEMTFPVVIHGVERMTASSGLMKQQGKAIESIELPSVRKAGSSELVVTLNPSLTTVMLDSLPYLADYPYGCVEQTMSRFVPSLIVAKTLKDLGYNLNDLRKRADVLKKQAAAEDKATAARNIQKNSPYTYPKGVPGSSHIGAAGSNFPRLNNPVFDERKLNRMVTAGFTRLYEMQHEDGGWGWWPDDSSDAYMSAYVLHGLITAKDAGYPIVEGRLERGLNFLKANFKLNPDLHMLAYESRVLSMDKRYIDTVRPVVTGRLYERRERLSAYSKALLAMALNNLGGGDDTAKAKTVLRNLETTAKVDEEGGTVHWEGSRSYWWCWWNDKVETNATVLQAYLQIDPVDKLVPGTMKWLVNNRRGDAWTSTKETALSVYALADYARVNKELAPDYTLTVDLGGRVQRKYTVNHQNAIFFDNQFVVPDGLLQTGKQPLTITKSGPGTLYYSAYTRYFSLEEPIQAVSNEIGVTRRYFRLIPGTAKGAPEVVKLDDDRPNPFLNGRYELLTEGGEWVAPGDVNGGPAYDRVELNEGDAVTSGDLIEVDLQLKSNNDYTYLIFEDMKPAGCEPVEVRSGDKSGLGVYSNMELRDQKVAFFMSNLPQGTRTLSYRLRAEIPGAFHVLPTNGYAMYAPDVRALSDERQLAIKDSPNN